MEEVLAVIERHFQAAGLPPEPSPDHPFRYRYMKVQEKRKSRYWKIDRVLLLEVGLNVEYCWVGTGRTRARVYRFSPQALRQLPEFMQDYKVRSFNEIQMAVLSTQWQPYWHFLPVPEKTNE